MIYVNTELIDKELKEDRNLGLNYKYRKLSKKFISALFNHWYLQELCENFYDSEPEFDEEEFNMYMDYKDSIKLTGSTFGISLVIWMKLGKERNFKYSKQQHTIEELKAAHDKVVQMYKDYESTRINFNNWQEPYFKGSNWGMSQQYVDTYGKEILMRIRNFPKSIKNRLFLAQTEEQIKIYFYGRDLWQVDYCFAFQKRNKRLR